MENLLGRQLKYNVQTPVYDGPLDLLLNLIEHAELDITTVSLAMVTDQYLVHINDMEQLNAEEISAFLVIAAKLIQIKSEALLPRPPTREPGEEDAGKSLVDQLKLYKRFKEIGIWLNEREQAKLRTYLRIAPPPKLEPKLDISNITIVDLVTAAEEVFAKGKIKKPLATVISAPRVTIREKIELITKVLNDTKHASFSDLVKGSTSRLEVVVTFLAMLELIKRYRVQAHQEGLFNDIELDRMEEWPDEDEFEIEFE